MIFAETVEDIFFCKYTNSQIPQLTRKNHNCDILVKQTGFLWKLGLVSNDFRALFRLVVGTNANKPISTAITITKQNSSFHKTGFSLRCNINSYWVATWARVLSPPVVEARYRSCMVFCPAYTTALILL